MAGSPCQAQPRRQIFAIALIASKYWTQNSLAKCD